MTILFNIFYLKIILIIKNNFFSNFGYSQPNYFIPSNPSNAQQWNQISNSTPSAPFIDPMANNSTPYSQNINFGFDAQLNSQYNSPTPAPQFSLQQQPGLNIFPQQLVSDPFFNTARHLGGQFAEIQKEKVNYYNFNYKKKNF